VELVVVLDALYYEEENIYILFIHFPFGLIIASELPILRTGDHV
jgi:hypothetical protein